jgi:hypothetical protein
MEGKLKVEGRKRERKRERERERERRSKKGLRHFRSHDTLVVDADEMPLGESFALFRDLASACTTGVWCLRSVVPPEPRHSCRGCG